MNRKQPNKRPRPSYEDGKLRDPKIAEMQDAAYTKGDLFQLIGKSAKKQAPTDSQPEG